MARKTLPELIDSLIGARTGGELGPKEAALEARLERDRGVGLDDVRIEWGPTAAAMTREERAAAVIVFLAERELHGESVPMNPLVLAFIDQGALGRRCVSVAMIARIKSSSLDQ
jgi:hypothetical protein